MSAQHTVTVKYDAKMRLIVCFPPPSPMPCCCSQSVPVCSANTLTPFAYLPSNWHSDPNFVPGPMQAFPLLNQLLLLPQPVQWPECPVLAQAPAPLPAVPVPVPAGAAGTVKAGQEGSRSVTADYPVQAIACSCDEEDQVCTACWCSWCV